MKRQTLDELGPEAGTRLRVFFPHGGGPREMVASGETRQGANDRYDFDHRLDGEWVPGWYVAVPAGQRRNIM